MDSLTRRRFVTLGATSTALALAGCSAAVDSASYADWVPATGERTLTAYIDLTVPRRTSTVDPFLPLVLPPADGSTPAEVVPDFAALDEISDPLLRFPLQTGGRIISVGSLSLPFAGLGYLVDPAEPTRGVTELFVANDAVIGTGDIDVERAADALRSGRPGPFGENRFEVVREGETYTYYEPVADISGAVAVNETAVVVADTRSEVGAVVAAHAGDHARAVDRNEVFGWLYEVAGTGDIAVAWEGAVPFDDYYWGSRDPDLPTDVVSTADDVAASLSFAPDTDEITAEFALHRDRVTDTAANRIERRFGTASSDASFSVGDDRLSATGTYASDALDVELVEPRNTTQRTTVASGDDVPASGAKAVPENAFEFVYNAEANRVRVNFVEEFEADRVTVRARESGSETSTTTPGPISYLSVYVAPDGDTVVVTVTVDGATGVVARKTVG